MADFHNTEERQITIPKRNFLNEEEPLLRNSYLGDCDTPPPLKNRSVKTDPKNRSVNDPEIRSENNDQENQYSERNWSLLCDHNSAELYRTRAIVHKCN